MARYLAPENDYRGVRSGSPGPKLSVAVVVPVYNRVDLLANTLAGLVAQTYETVSVVVADDGSEEDVAAVVDSFRNDLAVELVRQPHQGYGAGRARNLGAATSDADVLVFIDADCIPDPGLVARHAGWHRYADNLVIIGSRHHLDATTIDQTALRSGTADLRNRIVDSANPEASLIPDDFRRVFYRRTAGLRLGDEAFRALVSSNFSVRRQQFIDIGGFSEDFDRWGGEDTELGWRLFNDGFFFIPDNAAAIYHQTQEDGGDSPDWRQQSRLANDGVIQAKIPHRFYRKSERGYIYNVPKVSWVITPTVATRARELWDQLLKQTFTDYEAFFFGGDPEVDRLGEMLAGDPRITVLPDPADGSDRVIQAVAASRGEYVAILHGWASIDHRLLSRAVRRLDANPRASVLRCGYQLVTGEGSTTYIYDEAIDDIDSAWGELPLFALVRRREWAKELESGRDVADMWWDIQRVSAVKALRDGLVAIPALGPGDELPTEFPPITGERTQFYNDVTKGGAKRAARAVARMATAKAKRQPYRTIGLDNKKPTQVKPKELTEGPPGVSYIGWLGRENFGDEIMLEAVQRLLPKARVEYEAPGARLLLLGGGTLINRLTYLEALRRHDSPRVERAVFGTGVADPDYWGITEPVDQWIDFLDSCAYVGVRGPRSEAILRDWGYEGGLEVLGDPGLSIAIPATAGSDDGLVVVSPAFTGGELFGESDEAVFATIGSFVESIRAAGRRAAYLSCYPGDDRFIMEIMRRSNSSDAEYVAAYADHAAGISLVARADVVVAERLHAAVVAAATGTPFVALEYRPKLRDFARSVGQESVTIRTDELTPPRLQELVDVATGDTQVQSLNNAVARFRARQERVATMLAGLIGNSPA